MPWPDPVKRVVMHPRFDTEEEANLMGEHPELDPFEDDTPLECGLEEPEVCESCQ
tara:strand:+ start:523 stop:687 length:165 start_codon:yes stop_codon:yes gene_type:complete